MSRYRLALARATRKRYPALARERGLEGEVQIRLDVSAEVPAPDVTVARSSGYELLDAAAEEMIARAASRTRVPEALHGRSFSLQLPVSFDIRESE